LSFGLHHPNAAWSLEHYQRRTMMAKRRFRRARVLYFLPILAILAACGSTTSVAHKEASSPAPTTQPDVVSPAICGSRVPAPSSLKNVLARPPAKSATICAYEGKGNIRAAAVTVGGVLDALQMSTPEPDGVVCQGPGRGGLAVFFQYEDGTVEHVSLAMSGCPRITEPDQSLMLAPAGAAAIERYAYPGTPTS
jgi:hypothetical protein